MARVAEIAERRDCVSRRHHYVPQSYLRAWSRDGKRVRVLDTRRGTDKPRGLRDTCVQENFYRVTDNTNTSHNQVEAMLAVIDDETARLLSWLRNWRPGDNVKFTDFMSLSVVMAFQCNRTPQVRRLVAAQSEWMTKRAGQPATRLITDTYVDLLFRSCYETADEFSGRQLELWDDPQGRFITCDNPVHLSVENPIAPPSTLTSQHVWWPISPYRCLVLGLRLEGRKIVYQIAQRTDVERVRRAVIRGAESNVIALPGDRDLPAGIVLRRRPQLQVDCEPVDVDAWECRLRFGRGYGTDTLDRACSPLCAMRTNEPG